MQIEDLPSSSHKHSVLILPSGAKIRFDHRRIAFSSKADTQAYRGFEVQTGPADGFYFAAIFADRECLAVVGPAANAATAQVMALRWIDDRFAMASIDQAESLRSLEAC